jgi:hypothetical protein
MPNATVSLGTEQLDLKSLPGGYVTLKRMSYGQTLERRALMKINLDLSGGKQQDMHAVMALAAKEIQVYEFRHCVVDHNLEDGDGTKLDLTSAQALENLDPKVGQEIERKISDMNNFENDEGDQQK